MLRSRLYLTVVGSHFAVDTLNSLGAVLLTVLAGPLLLSNAQIGFALTLYLLMNALSQPLSGRLADRMPDRAMLPASFGVAWPALFFYMVALVLRREHLARGLSASRRTGIACRQ
jgi:MFS transporter, FSR family, fosmidomycin resistance protein